jgi:hypothetical protein
VLTDFADRLSAISGPGGSAANQAAGGGFPLPGSVQERASEAGQRGDIKKLVIEQIVAVDPEDAADKIARVLESRNFMQFDSPVTGPFTGFSKA